MPTLSLTNIADMLGIPAEAFPETARRCYSQIDWHYELAEGEEREAQLLRATRALFADLPVSGPARLAAWEKG